MRIVGQGILSAPEAGGPRAVATFPTITPLADGSLLASYSIGSGKDTADLDLELRRSSDGGWSWGDPVRPFETSFGGRRGSLKAGPITALGGERLIVAALWIDREAFPGAPLFNPDTEGCLPMAILVADSADSGASWSPWREVPMPDDVGPPSLTTALLRLPSGRLALSVESNKPYLDRSKWFQRVVYAWSNDDGLTWTEPRTVCADPTGRIANWDQRTGVTREGDLVAFTWTYDFEGAGEVPPPHWANATGKFAVRDLDGSKVLVKLAENPFAFAKRCRPFLGQTDLTNYTIQSDVRAMEKRRQMGDIGIGAQRYELVLFGSHQRLELQPWQPEVQRTARVDFPWKKDTWYTMKLEVQTIDGGKVRARGKVWERGQPEPAAWTIERVDPIGSVKGAASLYADAPSAAGGGSELYWDNIKVFRNQ